MTLRNEMIPGIPVNTGIPSYDSKIVRDLKKTRFGWSAVVHDQNDYEVDICMKGDVVENMDCSCPSASDGSYCPHMTAVLSAAADALVAENTHPVSVEEIVSGLDESTLRREFCAWLNEDTLRKESFLRSFGSEASLSRYPAKLRNELEEIKDKYSDRFGYIDNSHAHAYAAAFTDCLYENVRPLLDQKKNTAAFHTVNEAFRLICSAEMDGTDGEYGDIGAVIESLWLAIYYQCSPEEEEKMYDWFRDNYLNHHDLILYDTIESVYLNVFE